MLKKLIKLTVVVASAAVIFLFIAMNYSSVETRFECVGELTAAGNAKQSKMFLKIVKYRWWVGLWSDDDGMVFTEVPTQSYQYFEHLNEVGEMWQISDGYPPEIKGAFSAISNTLMIQTSNGFFEGACKPVS